MPFTGAPSDPWYSRIDWAPILRHAVAVAVLVLSYYGIHVSVEPKLPPAPAPVIVPADKLTLPELIKRLEEITAEQAKK